MQAIDEIQKWFAARCDGEWEHRYGFHLETTDNPGWQATIDEEVTDPELQVIAAKLKKEFGAECLVRERQFIVFAPTMQGCLNAVSKFLSARKS